MNIPRARAESDMAYVKSRRPELDPKSNRNARELIN